MKKFFNEYDRLIEKYGQMQAALKMPNFNEMTMDELTNFADLLGEFFKEMQKNPSGNLDTLKNISKAITNLYFCIHFMEKKVKDNLVSEIGANIDEESAEALVELFKSILGKKLGLGGNGDKKSENSLKSILGDLNIDLNDNTNE